METNSIYFNNTDVVKMFPISFERQEKYDRVLSEENLVDWIRGIAGSSSNLDKNSPHSYLITERLDSNFGKTSQPRYIEFLLGGYYVKLSDQGFIEANIGDGDIYAIIVESASTEAFRALVVGEDINSQNKFKALEIVLCEEGDVLQFTSQKAGIPHRLHILTKNGNDYTLPTDSMRTTYAVDGGELD